MLEGTQAEVGVLRHFVQAGGKLLDAVSQLLDLAGQGAQLALELLEADFLLAATAPGGRPPAAGGWPL